MPPFFHDGRVFFDAEAFAVEVAKLVLGAGVALFGSEFVPVGGAGVVLFDALTVFVHDAEVVLGIAVALSGSLFEAVRGVAGGAFEAGDGGSRRRCTGDHCFRGY